MHSLTNLVAHSSCTLPILCLFHVKMYLPFKVLLLKCHLVYENVINKLFIKLGKIFPLCPILRFLVQSKRPAGDCLPVTTVDIRAHVVGRLVKWVSGRRHEIITWKLISTGAMLWGRWHIVHIYREMNVVRSHGNLYSVWLDSDFLKWMESISQALPSGCVCMLVQAFHFPPGSLQLCLSPHLL